MPQPRQAKRGLSFQNNSEIEVTVASNAGACFGVVRAIKLGKWGVEKAKKTGIPIRSLGPLIHNPTVVGELREGGLEPVDPDADIRDGIVVLRSHGIRREAEKNLRDRSVELIDATCPLVKKPQRIAQGLADKGFFLVIVGDKQHPEVQGVVSYYGLDTFLVTYSPEDIESIPSSVERVGIIAQTTIEEKVLEQVLAKCQDRFKEVSYHNTICDATSVRQREAVALSEISDVMIVVGGKNSSNTNKLVKICKQNLEQTYHIEKVDEIDRKWLVGKKKIGVTGGASTPQDFVDEVGNYIAALAEEVCRLPC